MKKIVIPLILLVTLAGVVQAQTYYPTWTGKAGPDQFMRIPLYFPTEGSYTARDSVVSNDTTGIYTLPPYSAIWLYATCVAGQKNVDSVDAVAWVLGKDTQVGVTAAYAVRSNSFAILDSMLIATTSPKEDTMAGRYKLLSLPPNTRQVKVIIDEITGMEQTSTNVWKLWFILKRYSTQ